MMHSMNRNTQADNYLRKKIVILQLNCSNSNFMTKTDELFVTIESHKADIVIVSESNMDMTDVELIEERQAKFPNFSFIDKRIDPFPKARLTIMVHEDVPYERATEYEDSINPMASIKSKD